jgi:hypothetical protein
MSSTNYFKATYRTHGEASKLVSVYHFFDDRFVDEIERAYRDAVVSAEGMNTTYGRLHNRIGARVSVWRHPIPQGPWRAVLVVGEVPDMPSIALAGEN